MASSQALAPRDSGFRPGRIVIVALLVVVIGAAATLFGWDISGWCTHVWNTVTAISLGYLLAAIVLITLQTATTAVAWYSILRFAYPQASFTWAQAFACYATAVALNTILPANLGTLVMLIMFNTLIAGAGFAGILAAYVVQKVFYTVIGIACYLYLFLSVGGSFSLQLGFLSAHPLAAVILVVGGGLLLVLVARMLRERIAHWWQQAKVGGQILAHPRILSRPRAVSRDRQLDSDARRSSRSSCPPTTSP